MKIDTWQKIYNISNKFDFCLFVRSWTLRVSCKVNVKTCSWSLEQTKNRIYFLIIWKLIRESIILCLIQHFGAGFLWSQPQNPEFRINPENFHPCHHAPMLYSCKIGSNLPTGSWDILHTNIAGIHTKNSILFGWILYVPVNNFSVMSGWAFLGWASTKQRIVSCLRMQQSDSAGTEARTSNPSIPSLTLYQPSNCPPHENNVHSLSLGHP